MKLTTKQLKALPDSEFGIVKNGKRSYPLVDQNHVRSAISFFSYAAPEDKSELAKKINAKAKEYGMKIHCKGEFVKYISPEVSKQESFASYITDASHIGVLAPIVGANAPAYNDEKYSDESKILGAFAKGDLGFDTEFTEEGFVIRNFVDRSSHRGVLQLMEDNGIYKEPPDHQFDATFRFKVIDAITNREFEELRNYMTKVVDDSYISQRAFMDATTTEEIHNVIDKYDKTYKTDPYAYETLMSSLTSIILSDLSNKDRIVACLGIIYFKKPMILKNVVRSIIRYNSYYHCDLDIADDFFLKKAIRVKTENYVPASNKGLTADELAVFEYTFRNGAYFLNAINEYIFETAKQYGFNETPMDHFCRTWSVESAWTHGKFDGYYTETSYYKDPVFIVKNIRTKTYYIGNVFTGKDNLRYLLVIPILQFESLQDFPSYVSSITQYHKVYKKEKILKIRLLQDWDGGVDQFTALESTTTGFINETSLVNTVVNTSKNFLKGIHIGEDGIVKLNLTNKLSFEHYEEIHKTLKEADKNGNIEEVKSTLAYIFSIIATIERIYMNEDKGNKSKRSIDKNDEKYKEMVRLRALYMSDFKVYLRKVATKDPKFNFLEYYETSNMNNSVYTVDAKKFALIFRTIMVS